MVQLRSSNFYVLNAFGDIVEATALEGPLGIEFGVVASGLPGLHTEQIGILVPTYIRIHSNAKQAEVTNAQVSRYRYQCKRRSFCQQVPTDVANPHSKNADPDSALYLPQNRSRFIRQQLHAVKIFILIGTGTLPYSMASGSNGVLKVLKCQKLTRRCRYPVPSGRQVPRLLVLQLRFE